MDFVVALLVVPAKAGIHFAFAVACEDQKRFIRCAAEFISFGKPQKKRTKEKRFPPAKQSQGFVAIGIFRLALLARSKNGGHPCPPPSGSPVDCVA